MLYLNLNSVGGDMNPQKTLFLLRGLPGAGKSTLASILGDFLMDTVIEADNYFMVEGQYVFNPAHLHKAHKWCQQQAEQGMINGERVIVSNTFTTEKELKPYLDMAQKYGYSIVSLVVENRHGSHSVHNVPEETMEKMENRFVVKLR